jgi:hypothetical protein
LKYKRFGNIKDRAEMSDIRMIAFGSRGNELLRFR